MIDVDKYKICGFCSLDIKWKIIDSINIDFISVMKNNYENSKE